ncbi:MAG TPA: DUF1232 domain-containing protein, partial [Dehalococcoidia bacterium]|nr:DUF1232 domain-containing protein [Dehalococcoidia bacterium]
AAVPHQTPAELGPAVPVQAFYLPDDGARRRLPVWLRPLAMVPAAYMASPIDVLPDFIPFIGRLDDRFIASTAFWLIGSFAPESVLREHIQYLSAR